MANTMDRFNDFENKHRAFINLIIKPLLTLVAFLSMGYYTMWLSTNYVRQDKFSMYIEKQISMDRQQDDVYKTRFDLTQSKLEIIITQQTIFNEQLKTYNTLMASYQKQLDSINDRIIYLERKN